MSMDTGLLQGFANALTPTNLAYAMLGSVLGTLVGVLPGLGPSSAMAILLPLTLYAPVDGALVMLAAIFYGAMYGGSTTSILVNIPGEVSSVPTTIDGFQMTRQGRAGEALAISAVGSFIAGVLGTVTIGLVGPYLAEIALRFGSPEYVGIALLALITVTSFSGGSLSKGMAAALLGMLLAAVGIDPLTGIPRMTLGTQQLLNGIELVPVIIGLFGIGEMLAATAGETRRLYEGQLGSWLSMLPRGVELARGLRASVRASLLGLGLGVIPGMMPAVTSFIAYDVEKRLSKEPQRFGRGAIEGVAAPEAANNATAQAGFIPLLSLGIPTGPAPAILLAALILHGVRPGPLLFKENAPLVWTVVASMYIGNALLLFLNLPLVGLWARISLVPFRYLAPVVLSTCVVGSYAPRNNLFDVWVALIFGAVGYAMRLRGWPLAPVVLGFILGPMLERSLRQSLIVSHGSLSIFIHRPLTLILVGCGVTVALVLRLLTRRSGKAPSGSGETTE
jgi:putative tricarboxylic transport membrane protein